METIKLIYTSYLEIITVTKQAIQDEHILPALILIYSSIDSASFLATKSPLEPVNKRFKDWVKKWMFTVNKLPCTPEELYSARCGVVHTFTSSSNLTMNKKVRHVAYAWGSADYKKLQKSLDYHHSNKVVAVQVEDLFESFQQGLAKFFEVASTNNSLSEQLEERSKKYFSNLKTEDIDLYLKLKE